MKLSFYIFILAVFFVSCKTKPDTHTTVTNNPITFCKVVKELNNVVLENNFPPMVASRNYAYASIAAYECIALGDKNYPSFAGRLNQFKALPKLDTTNVDANLAAIFAFIKVGNAVTFPEGNYMKTYDKIKDSVKATGIKASQLDATVKLADAVAAHILAWSKTDNYLETRSAEKFTVIGNTEDKWIPTPPSYTSALEYKWSTIRTMVIDSAAQFKPVRPPAYNVTDKSSVFYKATLEVKTIGDSLTDEQKHIADFFDDNPFKMNVVGHVSYATKRFSPPGHWLNIVGIAAQESKSNFAQTVEAFAVTAIALFDGFISCWDEKYRSVLVRPETVINKHIDPNWRPFIQTPPFPSYTSGHSVTSAAAAEAMTSLLGDNFKFRDSSEREFGVADRNFTSFRHAAQEASISRLYGGIHYRFDLDQGAKQGEAVGKFIVSKLRIR